MMMYKIKFIYSIRQKVYKRKDNGAPPERGALLIYHLSQIHNTYQRDNNNFHIIDFSKSNNNNLDMSNHSIECFDSLACEKNDQLSLNNTVSRIVIHNVVNKTNHSRDPP